MKKGLKCCLIFFIKSVGKPDILHSFFHVLGSSFEFLKLLIESVKKFLFGKFSKMTHNIFNFDSNIREAWLTNIWYYFRFWDNSECSIDLIIELDLIDETNLIYEEMLNILNGLRVNVEIDVFKLLVNVWMVHFL